MKQLIYIPTKVEDELPEDGTIQFELCGKNKSVGWYQNGVRQHVGATEWLKPTEANVFTDEQLLELKKKWMSEAWDASKDYTFDAWDASANMHPTWSTQNFRHFYFIMPISEKDGTPIVKVSGSIEVVLNFNYYELYEKTDVGITVATSALDYDCFIKVGVYDDSTLQAMEVVRSEYKKWLQSGKTKIFWVETIAATG
jgi:hypothetical protein